MIDWIALLFHSAWVLGLALLLAILSFTHWLSRVAAGPWRQVLTRDSTQAWLWLALLLVCLGLAGTSTRAWEALLWSILVAFGLVQVVLNWRAAGSAAGRANNYGD